MICTDSPATDAPAAAAAAPALLSLGQQGHLLLLMSKGHSRRKAAEIVGCHPATVACTARHDSAFRELLIDAEERISRVALISLEAAAANPRYWRAALWILERKRSEEWGRPEPDTAKPDQLASILHSVLNLVTLAGVAAEQPAQVESHAREILTGVHRTGELAPSDAPPPPPSDSPAAANEPATKPSEPPARNALPESSVVTPSPQPVSDQPVASLESGAQRATPIEGVARDASHEDRERFAASAAASPSAGLPDG